jgi:elongation factor Ts
MNMSISPQDIKKLRAQTGAGMMDCRNALRDAKGDFEKAIELLRKKGAALAMKKSDREAHEGIIASYVHANGRMGSLVELACETDFVARNEEFKALANEIALHVAASSPKYISPDDVPAKEIEKEKEIYAEQIKKEGKPANIVEKILEGKIKKYKEENALLTQEFVRNPDMTVQQLIEAAVAKLGEKIEVTSFSRFEISGSPYTCVA